MELLGLSVEQIREVIAPLGMPAFRAKQISLWMASGVTDFADMTNLSNKDRELLAQHHSVIGGSIESHRISQKDGTEKFLFRFEDGAFAEGVLMQYEHGNSVCISSQSGCKMGCAFCASTLGGFKRSLSAGEILSQVYVAQKEIGERISHIVLMGMGEPLDNYDNVMRFITLVTDEKGVNLSMRNISLSTCGIVPKIYDLLDKKLQLTLSISLHAPTNELRDKIMPVNHRFKVEELLAACRKYAGETSRRISFEYAMLSGVNDSDECATVLASKLKGMLCHVNLIPVNEVKESPFKPSTPERVERFVSILSKNGINATVRRKLGSDIDASCGQLRRKEKEKNSAKEGEE